MHGKREGRPYKIADFALIMYRYTVAWTRTPLKVAVEIKRKGKASKWDLSLVFLAKTNRKNTAYSSRNCWHNAAKGRGKYDTHIPKHTHTHTHTHHCINKKIKCRHLEE